MKKNKIFLLFALSLCLTGCYANNKEINNNNNIASNSNVISQEDINNKINENSISNNSENFSLSDLTVNDLSIIDMKYYNEVFLNVNKFYEKFQAIGNSIDANDFELTSEYMTQLENICSTIKKIEVPEHFISSHSYLEDSIDKYIEGLKKLINSYDLASYDKYKDADNTLLSAGESMQIYLQYINEFTSDFASFLDILTQIDYYFKTITIYDYNEKFTEDENKFLYTLERNICNFTKYRELLINDVLNNKNISENNENLQKIINNIKELKIENENLNIYKENTIKYLESYKNYIMNYVDNVRKNEFNPTLLTGLNLELQTFGLQVYDNLEYLSNFYASYDIDLGFQNSETQLQQYNTQ